MIDYSPCFPFTKVRLLEPQMVMVKPRGKVQFTDVFCGAYFTFAISKDGHVYGFGLSNYHQLGRLSVFLISNVWDEKSAASSTVH